MVKANANGTKVCIMGKKVSFILFCFIFVFSKFNKVIISNSETCDENYQL